MKDMILNTTIFTMDENSIIWTVDRELNQIFKINLQNQLVELCANIDNSVFYWNLKCWGDYLFVIPLNLNSPILKMNRYSLEIQEIHINKSEEIMLCEIWNDTMCFVPVSPKEEIILYSILEDDFKTVSIISDYDNLSEEEIRNCFITKNGELILPILKSKKINIINLSNCEQRLLNTNHNIEGAAPTEYGTYILERNMVYRYDNEMGVTEYCLDASIDNNDIAQMIFSDGKLLLLHIEEPMISIIDMSTNKITKFCGTEKEIDSEYYVPSWPYLKYEILPEAVIIGGTRTGMVIYDKKANEIVEKPIKFPGHYTKQQLGLRLIQNELNKKGICKEGNYKNLETYINRVASFASERK